MIHLDEGSLQALVDGELAGTERRAAERHLEGCLVCRKEMALLGSASRRLAGALSLVDHPAPRARRPLAAAPNLRPAPSRSWGASRGLPRAAVLLLGFAATASATIPGSPVRTWIEEMIAPRPRVAAVVEAPAPPATTMAADAAAEAGVSVAPVAGEVRIVLRGASPELRVRALLVDGARAGVFARGDAAAAHFSTAPGRIDVEGAGAGELRIELPREARSATVTVNGRPYLTKEGQQLRAGERVGAEVSFEVAEGS